jgi:hypothetical protein
MVIMLQGLHTQASHYIIAGSFGRSLKVVELHGALERQLGSMSRHLALSVGFAFREKLKPYPTNFPFITYVVYYSVRLCVTSCLVRTEAMCLH